ncbi:fasciclin domain-containing protein [Chitinophaga sp. 30R24]|uniref:fasciclin domain-containing protein n=1 Tax=Chitinophaga sp. 30R24 TaxID=3248838 RepID=UPI003B91FE9B
MNKQLFLFWITAGFLCLTVACKKPDFEAQQTSEEIGTVSDYLKNNFDFSLFAAALQKSGLLDSLNKATASYTIFAPVNAALNKDSIYQATDFDKWTTDSLRYFVRTHILPGRLFLNDIPLSSDNRYKNINGVELYLSRSSDTRTALVVNGVNVQSTSSLSSTTVTYGITRLNGVIYPMPNTVKVLPYTIQDFLLSRGNLSHLVAGLKKFGLWDKLKGDGPFTVFAPLDSTFERYGITLDSINRMDVARYDPVVFGGYFLTPNHVFLLDILQLPPPTGVIYLAFPSPSPAYKTVIGQQPFGTGMGVVTAQSATTKVLVSVGPYADNAYGAQGTPFLQEAQAGLGLNSFNGTYVNYTLSNGVLHLLSDLLVMPAKVAR